MQRCGTERADLQILGGLELTIDGERTDVAMHVHYKGMMLTGIPNMASCRRPPAFSSGTVWSPGLL